MKLYTTTFTTPFGEFTAAVDGTGAVVCTAFGNLEVLAQRLIRGAGGERASFETDGHRTALVREQVEKYCRGEQIGFDVPLAPRGSAFQLRVWRALRLIPHGETRSYGDIARQLVTAPRAVGRANGSNPLCLLQPCHRVIGHDGSLNGFAFGEDLKRQLLEHEQRVAEQGAPDASRRESCAARLC